VDYDESFDAFEVCHRSDILVGVLTKQLFYDGYKTDICQFGPIQPSK